MAGDGGAKGGHCEAMLRGGGSIGIMIFAGADGQGAVHSGDSGQIRMFLGHFLWLRVEEG